MYILIFFIFNFNIYIVSAGDDINVKLYVNGCNNNFICESIIGEDINSCPNDCSNIPPNPTSTPPSGDNGRESGLRAIISITSIETTSSSIKIYWKSNIPVNASITWNNNISFHNGVIQEVGFNKYHNLYISNLDSNSPYTITFDIVDLHGFKTTHQIRVSTSIDMSIVPTVENFQIYEKEGNLVLKWENPASSFDYIRILKSESFFPANPFDGKVIYEGSAQSFLDSDILEDKRYFYSIFVRREEDYSTGVIQHYTKKSAQDFDNSGQPINNLGPFYDYSFISDFDKSDIKEYVNFFQNGKEITQLNNVFFIDRQKEVLVAIDRNKNIPIDSKIYITYFDSGNLFGSRSFIFNYDTQLKKFISSFLVKNEDPATPFVIYVQTEDSIKGYVGYFSGEIKKPTANIKKNYFIFDDLIVSIVTLLLIVLIIMWYLFLFFRKKEEDKK